MRPETQAQDVTQEENAVYDSTITLVGGGQAAAVIAFMIAQGNDEREVAKLQHIATQSPDDPDGNFPKYRINILTRKESQSHSDVKNAKGIFIKYREKLKVKERVNGQEVEKTRIVNHPPRILWDDKDIFVTDDVDNVSASDHIVILIKNIPGAYNEQLADKILTLIENSRNPSSTTVTMGTNGIPAWYLAKQRGSDEAQVFERLDEHYNNGAPYPSNVTELVNEQLLDELKFIAKVGMNRIVGCSLNLACSAEPLRKGGANYSSFQISTFLNEVNIPIEFARLRRPKDDSVNLEGLKEIFSQSRISMTTPFGIEHEMAMKLQLNTINALCAITGENIGGILGEDDYIRDQDLKDNNIKDVYYDMFKAMMRDVEQVMGLGVLRTEEQMKNRLEGSMRYDTTMAGDFARGRKMESEVILGRTKKFASDTERSPVRAITTALSFLNQIERKRNDYCENGVEIDEAVKLARSDIKVGFIGKCQDIAVNYGFKSVEYIATKEIKKLFKDKKKLMRTISESQNSDESITDQLGKGKRKFGSYESPGTSPQTYDLEEDNSAVTSLKKPSLGRNGS